MQTYAAISSHTTVRDRTRGSHVKNQHSASLRVHCHFFPCILRPDTNGFLYMAFKTDHVCVGVPICDLLPTNLVKDLPWPHTFFLPHLKPSHGAAGWVCEPFRALGARQHHQIGTSLLQTGTPNKIYHKFLLVVLITKTMCTYHQISSFYSSSLLKACGKVPHTTHCKRRCMSPAIPLCCWVTLLRVIDLN